MDDDGGRYTTQILNELFDKVITEPMHSKVEKQEWVQKNDEQISC